MAFKEFEIKKPLSTASVTTTETDPNDTTSNFEYGGVWMWDGFPRRCHRCRMLKDSKCLKKKNIETCRKSYKLKK